MAVLLVTYDLKTPGKNYNDLIEAIKNHSWARLSESSYAIVTSDPPGQVYSNLKSFLDENDHLYIITLRKPYSGYGPKAVNDWLEANLP